MTSTGTDATAVRGGRRAPGLLRSPLGVAAVASVALLVVLAVVAPILWGDAAAEYHPDLISQGPSSSHPLGTDSAGRDILLRVLVACRLSISLTLVATTVAVCLGLVLGSAPFLLGRRGSRWMTSLVATAVAFPSLLLAIFLGTIVGVGALGAVIAVGVAGAPWYARLTQTLVASMQSKDFVLAALVLGQSRRRVLVRHVLPNVAEPLAVNATIGAAANLLIFAGLSFLGLGVQSPDYDWGRLLLEGLNSVYVTPWAALAPGIVIVLASLAFNLAGEVAAQALAQRDPVPRGPAPTLAKDAGAPTEVSTDALLEAREITVWFPGHDGTWSRAVRGIDLVIARGEAVGLVGESGSGKSVTALAAARLLEAPASVDARVLRFAGDDLLSSSGDEIRSVLAGRMSFVFQDPMSSLNPAITVGRQVAEVGTEHEQMSRAAAWSAAVAALGDVQIVDPERTAQRLPHELSGGMRQRAMIAMALMGEPRLIIADEPTTALDVTVQRDVLGLLSRVRRRTGAGLLLISHDMAVVAGMCDRILVMYAGRIVEELPASTIVGDSRHPYTRALIDSLPDMTTSDAHPLPTIPGRPPSPDEVGPGCAFAPRCSRATERCAVDDPDLVEIDGLATHRVACWNPLPPRAEPDAMVDVTGAIA